MEQISKEFKKNLWMVCDELRGNISSERYMYIISGILFLKFMSDKFDLAKSKIAESKWRDSYLAEDLTILKEFGCPLEIPEKAHWNYIKKFAVENNIGEIIDNALEAIENAKGNEKIKGLLDKAYNSEEIDQKRLGRVVSIISNAKTNFNEDWIGRTYEYFIGKFMKKQGQKGGEFYTPNTVVKLLVKVLDPENYMSVYDPACGTGGMFIQMKKFLESEKKLTAHLKVYGQEFQSKTRKIAHINLFINGFELGDVNLGTKSSDSFLDDQHKNNKFDYVLANPPFNVKKWGYDDLKNDERFQWGLPPKWNANFAWVSIVLSKLKEEGKAGVVLANGALSSSNKWETKIRKKLVEANLLEGIITLPDKLFFTTQIPASLWIFNKKKTRNDFLFVHAGEFEGKLENKRLRSIKNEEIEQISNVFVQFRANNKIETVGFAKTVELAELAENDYILLPGRYVDFKEKEIDVEATKQAIQKEGKKLIKLLEEFKELSPKVEKAIADALTKEAEAEEN